MTFERPATGRRPRAIVAAVIVSSLLALVCLTATPASATPVFQSPFPCGETWYMTSYYKVPSLPPHGRHEYAIDFNSTANAYTALGRTVVASHGGTVEVRRDEVAGNHVIIRSDGGGSLYGHLQDGSIAVVTGQVVAQGTVIGRTGKTGLATGVHLHYEQWTNDWNDQPAVFDGQPVSYPLPVQPQLGRPLTSNNCGGGSATVDPDRDRPSMVVRESGEVNVVARGAGDTLDYWFAAPGAGFYGHLLLGNTISAPALTVRSDGEAQVVGRGPGDTLDYYFLSPGSPTVHHLVLGSTTASPSIVVRPSGETNVVARGPGGTIDYYWSDAQGFHGPLVLGLTSSAPDIVVRSDGEAQVVARGPADTLDYYFLAPGSPTVHHLQIGSTTASPSIVVRPSGETNVVARGPGGTIDYYWSDAQGFHGPLVLGGTISAPDVVVRSDGEAQVVARGPLDTLDYYFLSPGSPTVHHLEIGATVASPSIVVRESGETDVVAREAGGGLRYRWAVPGAGFVGSLPVPTPPTAPGAPREVVALAGVRSATVSWQPPTDGGGAPITSYTVTAAPGGQSCTASGQLSCVVPGLTTGSQYTFSVTAATVHGVGPASVASTPVSPK